MPKSKATRLESLEQKKGTLEINVLIIDDAGNVLDDGGQWIPEAKYRELHNCPLLPGDEVIHVTSAGGRY